MRSAVLDQRSHKYKKIIGKTKTWYVALVPNEGDFIYMDPNDEHSDGFAGRTLDFQLEDGTTDLVKGPWHSNSTSLFNDTGYDTRDKHHTKVTISFELSDTRTDGMFRDPSHIVYRDPGFELGNFERGEKMAQELANIRKCRVFYTVKSLGGARQGSMTPEEA